MPTLAATLTSVAPYLRSPSRGHRMFPLGAELVVFGLILMVLGILFVALSIFLMVALGNSVALLREWRRDPKRRRAARIAAVPPGLVHQQNAEGKLVVVMGRVVGGSPDPEPPCFSRHLLIEDDAGRCFQIGRGQIEDRFMTGDEVLVAGALEQGSRPATNPGSGSYRERAETEIAGLIVPTDDDLFVVEKGTRDEVLQRLRSAAPTPPLFLPEILLVAGVAGIAGGLYIFSD